VRAPVWPLPAGLPVVLVHGMVISSRYMERLAEVLGRYVPVLAPDLPGYGESTKPRHALSLPELADSLGLLLRASGVPKAMFVGNSFGCQVLVELALRHPDQVDRLVLQAPTPDPAARSWVRQVWRIVLNNRLEPAKPAQEARIDYAKAGLPRAVATLRMLVRDPIEAKLPRVSAPTLVVRGTRDPVVSQQWAERAAGLLPQGRLALLEGGTHTLNHSYPGALAALILPFLRESGAGGLAS
jgi:pimeloyl-ACP methyl ester carboxylesterase